MMNAMKFLLGLLLVSCLLVAHGRAQDGSNAEFSRLAALRQVSEPLSDSIGRLDRLRTELKAATDEDQKTALERQIADETLRLDMLRDNFRSILGGAEAAEYENSEEDRMTIEELVVDLLEPISRAVRDASTSPRELEVLSEGLELWKKREGQCDAIIKRIDELSEGISDPELLSEFESARRFWIGRRAECRSQVGVYEAQLEERNKVQRPMLERLSDGFSAFFKSRGLNLLLGVFTGVLIYVLLRQLHVLLCRISPIHKGKPRLTSRLIDIVAATLSVFLALWGVMLVFYLRGDWLLLTLVVLFLIGAVWAGKTALPPYVEQVRTYLNLGSIREGERVIYEGLPWQVSALGFWTTLENPRLEGGSYRIPLRKVMHMTSRQADDKEPWFPTEKDDWVVLSDETYGKVVTQTPEQVVVLQMGGSHKTYTASDFIEQTPENLSHGFRISCIFGVDYQHQALSTGEIPVKLQEALTKVFFSEYEREDIHSIQVEFESAGASSLDYRILVDVTGNLAHRYEHLSRAVQKVCVDACNDNGWVIPFTQITVHQAES